MLPRQPQIFTRIDIYYEPPDRTLLEMIDVVSLINSIKPKFTIRCLLVTRDFKRAANLQIKGIGGAPSINCELN